MVAKKQLKGAPPIPAVKAVPVKKLTRKEKHVINSARAAKIQHEAHEEVKAMIAERVSGYELKPLELRGKDDPSLPTDKGTKIGRPSVLYTKSLDERLFELLCVGTSLDNISNIKGTPGLGTMIRWLSDDTHKFSKTYTRARALVIPLYEDRALAAALIPVKATVTTHGQRVLVDGSVVDVEETRESDNVERAKLMLTGYQWALGWMVPKKHGRQADVTSGQPNEQLTALFNSLKSGPAEPKDD